MATTQKPQKRSQNGHNANRQYKIPPAPDAGAMDNVQNNGMIPPGDTDPNLDEHPSARQKVIKFSNVSKRFTLHHEKARSFQDVVVSLFGLRTLSKRGVALPRPVREDFWALRDVNFGIYEGESVGIIGENGSGKSTSLKLMSRILEPTSGSVSVKGKVSALLELGTGFHPDLTGRENIFLNGSLLGIPRKEMVDRYQAIVDFSELHEFIDTPIKHYSSGMVMRLGFAVAINVDPDILLTDEVLAVGDEAFQRKCLDHIATLRRRGVTIVFVSHALDAIRGTCQRAIWLDHGQVVADGPSGDVIDQYLAFENNKHAEHLRATSTQRRNAPPPTPIVEAPPVVESLQQDELKPEVDQPAIEETVERQTGPSDRVGSRFTTGRAEITDVQFIDGGGHETKAFETGNPLTIRIFYDADEEIKNPIFGLALYSQSGIQLNGPNTRFAGVDIPSIKGTGYIDYTIPELPLLSGIYDVTVAVTGAEMVDVLDHQHRSYGFYVQPTPGMAERWGLLNIPSEWSIHPDS